MTATRIPLSPTDYQRLVTKSPGLPITNRYFEKNPTNISDQVALVTRPGLKKWLTVGSGPIRQIYSQIGSFNDDLFVISGEELYRINADTEVVTYLDNEMSGGTATPSMVATSALGSTPEYLYIADGKVLWVYNGTTLSQVAVPDDLGVTSVAYIAGYIIVVVAADEGMNGRFYWIEPGETTIDALNFATAERAPDPTISCRVVGDQIWFLGKTSTEVWYPSGSPEAPFMRTQGRAFDRGIWEGTDIQIKDTVILVDTDGVVYTITGGGPQRISDNSIEEQIRKAVRTQVLG
jgi:hypothetical protein